MSINGFSDSSNGSTEDAFSTTHEMTRRECVSVLGATPAAAGVIFTTLSETATPCEGASLAQTLPVEIHVNGARHNLTIDPRVSLLDLLREHLELTGTKKGCDHGQCGACTVLVNGRRINSCLTLAVSHHGDDITTVEGLARGRDLETIQMAFVDNDAFQCGYCTPGQICSAVALLSEARRGEASFVTEDLARLRPIELTDDEIRERMSGNICRCGAYPGIVAAVKSNVTATADQGRKG